ncbi:MAG: glycosyltransferase family 9 protein [Crocinitomicaceae bacterium]
MKKVLFLRFSSIGDIVLTFPIVKALKEQLPKSEIHYATKRQFRELMQGCTSIDYVHTFEKRTTEIWSGLKKENFDFVIDLHNNLRSRCLSGYLNKKTFRYPKLNIQKWILVALKWDFLPSIHVVDRYFESVQKLGIKNTHQNNSFYIPKEAELNLKDWELKQNDFVAITLGAQFKTKQFPFEKLVQLIDKLPFPIVLLGGKSEVELAEKIIDHYPERMIVNFTNKISILEASFIVKNAASLVTNDTGIMHIASCFDTPIHLTWGNTVRKFGMYSYRPLTSELTSEYEVKLSCRPCSKIGFDKCPKGHHKCMMNIDELKIVEGITRDLSNE